MFHHSLDMDNRIEEKKVASRGITRSFKKRVSTPPTLLHQQIINSFDKKIHLNKGVMKQYSKRKQRQISIDRFYKKLQYFQMQSQQRDNLKEQEMHQYDLMRTLKAWNTSETKATTDYKDSTSFDKYKSNQQFQQWRKYFVQDQLQKAYDAIQKGNQPKQALIISRNYMNQEPVDSEQEEEEEEEEEEESQNESDSQPDCDNIPDIQLNLTTTIQYDDSPHNSSIYSQKPELNLELNAAQSSKDAARSKMPLKLGVHIPNFSQMSQFSQSKIDQRSSSRILQKVVTPIQQRIQDQSYKQTQISPLMVGGAFTQTSPVEQYFSQTSGTPQNNIIAQSTMAKQLADQSSFQRVAANSYHITDIRIRSNSNSTDTNSIRRIEITNNKNIDLTKANNQKKQSRKSFFSDNQRIQGQDMLLPPRYSAAYRKSKQQRQQINVKNQESNTAPAVQLGLSKINFPMAHQNIPSNSKIKFPVLRGVGQTMKYNDRNEDEDNNKNSYILLSNSQITNYKNNLRQYALIKAKRQQMKQNQSKNYRKTSSASSKPVHLNTSTILQEAFFFNHQKNGQNLSISSVAAPNGQHQLQNHPKYNSNNKILIPTPSIQIDQAVSRAKKVPNRFQQVKRITKNDRNSYTIANAIGSLNSQVTNQRRVNKSQFSLPFDYYGLNNQSKGIIHKVSAPRTFESFKFQEKIASQMERRAKLRNRQKQLMIQEIQHILLQSNKISSDQNNEISFYDDVLTKQDIYGIFQNLHKAHNHNKNNSRKQTTSTSGQRKNKNGNFSLF